MSKTTLKEISKTIFVREIVNSVFYRDLIMEN